MQYVAPYPAGHQPVNNYNYSQEQRDPHPYQPVSIYHQNLPPPQNLSQNIPCKSDPSTFEQQNNFEQQSNYPDQQHSFQHHQNNFAQPTTPSQAPEPVSMVYGEPPISYAPQEPVQSPAPSMEPPTPQIPPPVETQYSDSDSGSDYDPKDDGVSKVKVEPKKEETENEEDDEEVEEVNLDNSDDDDDSDSDYGSKKPKPKKRKRAPPKPRQTRQSSTTASRATRSAKGKKSSSKRDKEEETVADDIKDSALVKKESVTELSNQVQVLFLPSESDPPNVAMLKKRLLELSETDIEKTKKLKLLQNLTWRQKKEIQKLKEEIKKIKGRGTQNSTNA